MCLEIVDGNLGDVAAVAVGLHEFELARLADERLHVV